MYAVLECCNMFLVYCTVFLCVAACHNMVQCVALCCIVLQCVAVCCSVLQCVAVCCSVLQCVAVCCFVLQCMCAHLFILGPSYLQLHPSAQPFFYTKHTCMCKYVYTLAGAIMRESVFAVFSTRHQRRPTTTPKYSRQRSGDSSGCVFGAIVSQCQKSCRLQTPETYILAFLQKH